MRVVIDTNVLVSAALKDRDPEAVITWVVAHPDWLWLVTPEILAEYKEVLSRPKFGLPKELLDRWLALLAAATTPVVVDLPIEYPRDQKDAFFSPAPSPRKPITWLPEIAISRRRAS